VRTWQVLCIFSTWSTWWWCKIPTITHHAHTGTLKLTTADRNRSIIGITLEKWTGYCQTCRSSGHHPPRKEFYGEDQSGGDVVSVRHRTSRRRHQSVKWLIRSIWACVRAWWTLQNPPTWKSRMPWRSVLYILPHLCTTCTEPFPFCTRLVACLVETHLHTAYEEKSTETENKNGGTRPLGNVAANIPIFRKNNSF
jgi:hypothetical protein